MLILLRTPPDERLREVIDSIVPTDGLLQLVYLEGSLESAATPLILPGATYALDAPPPGGISAITQEALLQMIHHHPRILVLP